MVRASRHENSLESYTSGWHRLLVEASPRAPGTAPIFAQEKVLSGESPIGLQAEPDEPQDVQQ
jgi:hypothetical protein